jgi:hypothetical protein
LLPKALIGLLSVGLLVAAAARFAPDAVDSLLGGRSPAANVVTFDPVKFMNAQRAAASILATKPSADLALTITQVASKADAVIAKHARGATVLVKQAVVSGTARDITDEVLRDFGLPTDVPTVTTKVGGASTAAGADDLRALAPSDLAYKSKQNGEDQREEAQKSVEGYQDKLELIAKQKNMLP